MNWKDFDEGLQQRGFVGIDQHCSKGKCHLNEKHYILLTDGLVIYSTEWDHDMCRPDSWCYIPGAYKREWALKDGRGYYEDFTFEELDKILNNS